MTEYVGRRALGGVQCVDSVTKASILDPLMVTSDQLTMRPNRSGVFVVWDGPGLHQATTFVPPTSWPPPADYEMLRA